MLDKAQRYHGRADECRRLAKIGNSSDIRNHYRRMAEYYAAFAEAEEAKGRGGSYLSLTSAQPAPHS